MAQFTVEPYKWDDEELPDRYASLAAPDALRQQQQEALNAGMLKPQGVSSLPLGINPATIDMAKIKQVHSSLLARNPKAPDFQTFLSGLTQGGQVQSGGFGGMSMTLRGQKTNTAAQRTQSDLLTQQERRLGQGLAFEQERFDETTTYQRGEATSAIQREQQKEAGITPVTLDWKMLGVADPATLEPGTPAFGQYRGTIKAALRNLLPVYDAPDETISRISRGEKVEVSVRSLGAGELGLGETESDLRREMADLDKAIERARVTGNFIDPDTGLSQDTLEKLRTQMEEAGLTGLYKGQITMAGKEFNLREELGRLDGAIARANATGTFIDPDTGESTKTLDNWRIQLLEASVTGIYQGKDTLAKLAQNWDEDYQWKKTFGYTRDDGVRVYGTNELPFILQQDEQGFRTMWEAGFDWVNPDTGEEYHVQGTQEKVTDERQWEERTRVGYDQPIIGPDGKIAIDPRTNLPRTIHIEGTQEASVRLSTRELDLQEAGMNIQDAHNQALLEDRQRERSGYWQTRTIDLAQMGVSNAEVISLLTSAGVPVESFQQNGRLDLSRLNEWAVDPANIGKIGSLSLSIARNDQSPIYRTLKSMLGRAPTEAEVGQLLRGSTVAAKDEDGNDLVEWIPGTVSLEQDRMDLSVTLQENGFIQQTAERIAAEAFDAKMKTGGSVWDPGTSSWIVVRGVQEEQEFLLTLQNDLNISADEARALRADLSRTGYDRYVTTEGPDGKTTTQLVHIEGSQEYGDKLDKRADLLTRDGWDKQDARDLANRQEMRIQTWGGWYEEAVYDEEAGTTVTKMVWHPGSQEHEATLRTQADTLVRDGWGADMALETVRHLNTLSTNEAGYLEEQYLTQRAWKYENIDGLDPTAAHARAAEDWRSLNPEGEEGVFGEPLQVVLQQMHLDAVQAQREDDREFEMLTAAIGLIGSMANNAGGDLISGLYRLITGQERSPSGTFTGWDLSTMDFNQSAQLLNLLGVKWDGTADSLKGQELVLDPTTGFFKLQKQAIGAGTDVRSQFVTTSSEYYKTLGWEERDITQATTADWDDYVAEYGEPTSMDDIVLLPGTGAWNKTAWIDEQVGILQASDPNLSPVDARKQATQDWTAFGNTVERFKKLPQDVTGWERLKDTMGGPTGALAVAGGILWGYQAAQSDSTWQKFSPLVTLAATAYLVNPVTMTPAMVMAAVAHTTMSVKGLYDFYSGNTTEEWLDKGILLPKSMSEHWVPPVALDEMPGDSKYNKSRGIQGFIDFRMDRINAEQGTLRPEDRSPVVTWRNDRGQEVYTETFLDFAERNGVTFQPLQKYEGTEIKNDLELSYTPRFAIMWQDGSVRLWDGLINNGTFAQSSYFEPGAMTAVALDQMRRSG